MTKKHKKQRKGPTGCFRIIVDGKTYDDWTEYQKTKAFRKMKREYEERVKTSLNEKGSHEDSLS